MENKSVNNKENERKHLTSYNLILVVGVILVAIFFLISFVYFDDEYLKEYLNSEIFKTVIISIVFPLIIFLWTVYEKQRNLREEALEKQRNLRDEAFKEERDRRRQELEKQRNLRDEAFKEERDRRRQELDEKKKLREQELKNKRLTSIEKTCDEWNQINSLISQVRFCEGKYDPKLKEVQLKIAEQSISFGKLIYYWSESFPVVPDSIISIIVKYTATLYWGSWAVAYSIRNHDYEIKEIKELQESFGIFQRGVVRIAFLNLVYILKNSSKLLEYIEGNGEYDEKKQVTIIDAIKVLIENEVKGGLGKNEKESLLMKIYENKNLEPDKDNYNFIMDRLLEYKEKIPSEEDIKTKVEANEQLKNYKIDSQMKTIITNLLKSAYILKMNELLLGIDIFVAAAITPKFIRTLNPFKSIDSISRSNNKDPADKSFIDLGNNFEKVIDMVQNVYINKGIDKDDDKVGNKEITYKNVFNTTDYKDFLKGYYKMPSDKLLDVIAYKSIEYIEIVGKTIRLEGLIFSDDLSPVN